jgi:hypothetical protein
MDRSFVLNKEKNSTKVWEQRIPGSVEFELEKIYATKEFLPPLITKLSATKEQLNSLISKETTSRPTNSWTRWFRKRWHRDQRTAELVDFGKDDIATKEQLNSLISNESTLRQHRFQRISTSRDQKTVELVDVEISRDQRTSTSGDLWNTTHPATKKQ